MTALANKRATKLRKYSSLNMLGKNEQVFQGGIACIDTATGLVAKGFVATTLRPIGTYDPVSPGTDGSVTTASGGRVNVKLFREVEAAWFVNAGGGDAVTAAMIGSFCYITDDQTVQGDDDTNTKSVMGTVWDVDTVKGVLVEPLHTAGSRQLTSLDF